MTDDVRIGRRKALLLALSLQVSCSIICALVNNVYLFLVVRFLLGIQTTGELQAAFIIGISLQWSGFALSDFGKL